MSAHSDPNRRGSWKIRNLLRIPTVKAKPKTVLRSEPRTQPQTPSPAALEPETTVHKCLCCGTLLTYPHKSTKFRCSVCETTTILVPAENQAYLAPLSYALVRAAVDACLEGVTSEESRSIHTIFEPVSLMLYELFKSYACLNSSFRAKRSSTKLHYSTLNLNQAEIRATFHLLLRLPTKRPLFQALRGACHLTKRIDTCSSRDDDPRTLLWLLILLEIPFLLRCLTNHHDSRIMYDNAEIRTVTYEILMRCLGVLLNLGTSEINKNYLASWFSKCPKAEFVDKIDLMNLYITFHLRKYVYMQRGDGRPRLSSAVLSLGDPHGAPRPVSSEPNSEPRSEPRSEPEHLRSGLRSAPRTDFKDDDEEEALFSNKFKRPRPSSKVRIQQYGHNWHIKSLAIVLSLLWRANSVRDDPVPVSSFYNSLVDYVNMKLDFDVWQQFSRKSDDVPLSSVLDYINGSSRALLYYMCQYPFLVSLGGKISVLEYEAKRQMERKAEEAFINSLDKRVALDVHFRVSVRRLHIVQDSLRAIKLALNDILKKSLKVHFVNEPGIDAGGLKKEWFLILTKEIFNPQAGMLHNVDESNLLWLNIMPIDDFDMYYLFGSILGLAIYNLTILDLQFPLAMYKVLIRRTLVIEDFRQIFPETYSNLLKLKELSPDELVALDLTFEVTYKDTFGKIVTVNLIKNGANITVGPENLVHYIKRYWSFFLQDGIAKQLDALQNGFLSVVGGNALSLFLPEEIQLLVCGTEEANIDFDVLRSVTRYVGFGNDKEPRVVSWFWEYASSLTLPEKKKLLLFVTGSDRLPATGIQNLNFKISLLEHGRDSNRLPVAHTCFNELAIYNYETKEKLIEKLTLAVNESEGFGIK